eukprot:jgi/Ulvmu1/9135/UM005_0233.1
METHSSAGKPSLCKLSLEKYAAIYTLLKGGHDVANSAPLWELKEVAKINGVAVKGKNSRAEMLQLLNTCSLARPLITDAGDTTSALRPWPPPLDPRDLTALLWAAPSEQLTRGIQSAPTLLDFVGIPTAPSAAHAGRDRHELPTHPSTTSFANLSQLQAAPHTLAPHAPVLPHQAPTSAAPCQSQPPCMPPHAAAVAHASTAGTTHAQPTPPKHMQLAQASQQPLATQPPGAPGGAQPHLPHIQHFSQLTSQTREPIAPAPAQQRFRPQLPAATQAPLEAMPAQPQYHQQAQQGHAFASQNLGPQQQGVLQAGLPSAAYVHAQAQAVLQAPRLPAQATPAPAVNAPGAIPSAGAAHPGQPSHHSATRAPTNPQHPHVRPAIHIPALHQPVHPQQPHPYAAMPQLHPAPSQATRAAATATAGTGGAGSPAAHGAATDAPPQPPPQWIVEDVLELALTSSAAVVQPAAQLVKRRVAVCFMEDMDVDIEVGGRTRSQQLRHGVYDGRVMEVHSDAEHAEGMCEEGCSRLHRFCTVKLSAPQPGRAPVTVLMWIDLAPHLQADSFCGFITKGAAEDGWVLLDAGTSEELPELRQKLAAQPPGTRQPKASPLRAPPRPSQERRHRRPPAPAAAGGTAAGAASRRKATDAGLPPRQQERRTPPAQAPENSAAADCRRSWQRSGDPPADTRIVDAPQPVRAPQGSNVQQSGPVPATPVEEARRSSELVDLSHDEPHEPLPVASGAGIGGTGNWAASSVVQAAERGAAGSHVGSGSQGAANSHAEHAGSIGNRVMGAKRGQQASDSEAPRAARAATSGRQSADIGQRTESQVHRSDHVQGHTGVTGICGRTEEAGASGAGMAPPAAAPPAWRPPSGSGWVRVKRKRNEGCMPAAPQT